MLADLTPPFRGLQLQPLSRLFLPIRHGAAAVVAAVAGRGVEAGLEQLPPLPQLRVPVDTTQEPGPQGAGMAAWPGPLASRGNMRAPANCPPSWHTLLSGGMVRCTCSPSLARKWGPVLFFSQKKGQTTPPASKATLLTGPCLQLSGVQHTRAHTANPSLQRKGCPAPAIRAKNGCNKLFAGIVIKGSTNTSRNPCAVRQHYRVSPPEGRDHEATWWEKRRGLHRKPSKQRTSQPLP